ncbi:MAG: D-glycero-beta-D-manno-heptose 1-phosphate adenylyltransferase, partial [bacterium]
APCKRVLLIGDAMLDEYVFGSVSRISPEAPVPVVKQERVEWRLGGAANVAANCRHIGLDIDVVALINESDFEGKKICSLFTNIGLNPASLISVHNRQTTCKRRIISGTHQCLRIDHESEELLSLKEFDAIKERIDACFAPDSVVLISDYNKGVVDSRVIAHVVQKARASNTLVLADPKGPAFEKYRGVNYLKPNLAAFGQMVKHFNLSPEESMDTNARKICDLLALDGLIVTMGEKGIRFISHTQDIFSPAIKREVYDVSGAGDTVFAFLALALAHDISMKDSLCLANMAASVAVSHMTTYAVSLEELIDKELEMSEKVVHNWARLKIELDWLKSEGKRIVFTNGCFDLLHSGHIHTLVGAKKQGDILVVALNTDESVKRFKGPARPINDLLERVSVMSAIGVVDFVTSFAQDTPRELVEYLQPDVLVKGGDYKAENIAGYDAVIAYGGAVKIINYIADKSTTKTVQAIREVRKNSVDFV